MKRRRRPPTNETERLTADNQQQQKQDDDDDPTNRSEKAMPLRSSPRDIRKTAMVDDEPEQKVDVDPETGMMASADALKLPAEQRHLPLDVKVRLWNVDRRRSLLGDKRPDVASLLAFLASNAQFHVHPSEERALAALSLCDDAEGDGLHERLCVACREAAHGDGDALLHCSRCTFAFHRGCVPVPDSGALLCLLCAEAVAVTAAVMEAEAEAEVPRSPVKRLRSSRSRASSPPSAPPLPPTPPPPPPPPPPPGKRKSRIKGGKRTRDKTKATSNKKSAPAGPKADVGVPVPDQDAFEAVSAMVGAKTVKAVPSGDGNIFSRDNFRHLLGFVGGLFDDGHISRHELGLMKNLIIARDDQVVVMLSIADLVKDGGDVLDAIDSLRRILLVQ